MFKIIVALNQLACAVIFFPIAMKRETICGLIGRYTVNGNKLAEWIAPIIEKWFHKSETCQQVYEKEEKAREILYG